MARVALWPLLLALLAPLAGSQGCGSAIAYASSVVDLDNLVSACTPTTICLAPTLNGPLPPGPCIPDCYDPASAAARNYRLQITYASPVVLSFCSFYPMGDTTHDVQQVSIFNSSAAGSLLGSATGAPLKLQFNISLNTSAPLNQLYVFFVKTSAYQITLKRLLCYSPVSCSPTPSPSPTAGLSVTTSASPSCSASVSPSNQASASVSPSSTASPSASATSCYNLPVFINATAVKDLDSRPTACTPATACPVTELLAPIYTGMGCQSCWDPSGTYPTWRLLLTLPANSTPAFCTLYPSGDGTHDATTVAIYASNAAGVQGALLGQRTSGGFSAPYSIALSPANAPNQYLFFLVSKTTTYQIVLLRIQCFSTVFQCTATPSASASASASVSPSKSASPSVSTAPSPSVTPTHTGSDTGTATVTASLTASPTRGVSASGTAASTVSSSFTPTASGTPPITGTPAATPTVSAAATPSQTATPSAAATGSSSGTASSAPTVSASAIPSATPSTTATASNSFGVSPSAGATPSTTATSSTTQGVSASQSAAASVSASAEATQTITPTVSLNFGYSPSATPAAWTSRG